MPKTLRNEADSRAFQAGLDRMDAIALGRRSHAVTANRTGRLRIVVSSTADGLERRTDGWWWNPATVETSEMLARILPEGGAVGVPGGRDVFDLFLAHGYTRFHLTRAHGVTLPGGVAVFSACDHGQTAEDVLAASGMAAGDPHVLDEANSVVLTEFIRP
ncbi:hypothetical protein HNS03_05275 [Amorphus sp. 3PC139-8]